MGDTAEPAPTPDTDETETESAPPCPVCTIPVDGHLPSHLRFDCEGVHGDDGLLDQVLGDDADIGAVRGGGED